MATKQGGKASVANLLQMYSEATAAKGECEKKFLVYMQDIASKGSSLQTGQQMVVQELKRQLEQAERTAREFTEKARQQQESLLSGLIGEKDQLQSLLEDRNSTIAKLREALSRAKDELQLEQYELSAAKHRLEESVHLHEEDKQAQQQMSSQITELRAAIALKDHTLDTLSEKHHEQLETTQAQLERLHQTNELQQLNYDTLRQSYTEVMKSNQQLNQELEKLVLMNQQKHDEVEKLQALATKLSSELHDIKSEESDSVYKQSSYQTQIDQLNTELERQRVDFEQRQEQANQHLHKLLSELQPHAAERQAGSEDAQQDRAFIDQTAKDLSLLTGQLQQGQILEATLQKTKDDIAHLLERLQTLQNEKQSAEKELNTSQDQLKHLAEQYEQLSRNKDATEQNLHQAQQDTRRLSDDLASAKAHVFQLQEELKTNVSNQQSLGQQLQAQRDQQDFLKLENAQLVQQLADAQKTHAEELNLLRDRSRGEQDGVHHEYETLKRHLEELKDQQRYQIENLYRKVQEMRLFFEVPPNAPDGNGIAHDEKYFLDGANRTLDHLREYLTDQQGQLRNSTASDKPAPQKRVANMNSSIKFLMMNQYKQQRNSSDQGFLSNYVRSSDARPKTQIYQTVNLNQILDHDYDDVQ